MPPALRPIAVTAFVFVLAAPVVSHADVIYGNLGATGTAAIGHTNTDFGADDTMELRLAQGFTTGTSAVGIQSVTLGLWASTGTPPSPRTVSIFGTAAGVPDVPLYTSQAVPVGDTGKYTFPFSNALLAASSTYWIVPNGSASWYVNASDSAPTGLNGSGFSYFGTLRDQPGVGWTLPNPNLDSYSISVVAVPEPPAVVLSGIGLATAMYAMRRRG